MSQSLSSVPDQPLPPGFVEIRDVLDGKFKIKSKVNLVGVVVDFRVPIATRRTDWKCQMRLIDSSVQYEGLSIQFNVFRPENEMPTVSGGDVVLIKSVTVNQYQMDSISLMTSWDTKIYVYTAAEIPRFPRPAERALKPPSKPNTLPPSKNENEYVSYMFHTIDKTSVPDESTFEVMKIQSANVKEKYSELKDVSEGGFYDIIAQVVKEPYDLVDKFTLHVSDYTENQQFFHYDVDAGSNATAGRDGDEFGYTTKFTKSSDFDVGWKGPLGKRTLQVTVYEPHATAIRETPRLLGRWVRIRNLQIKYGKNAIYFEGFLREDRKSRGPTIRIELLETDDPENLDPRLKDAIRRKRDHERTKKDLAKGISNATEAGKKRKAEMPPESDTRKPNSRKKRNASRAGKSKKKDTVEAVAPHAVESPQTAKPPQATYPPQVAGFLNSQGKFKCEHENEPATSVEDMLQPIFHTTTIDGQAITLQLPFANTNFRANVRVVDFMPRDIKDFAFPKKQSEYDALSDNDESESSGSESEQDVMTDFTTKRDWEWRFFLELEDAVVPENQEKKRVWVVVDNSAAQCLVNLDASNLRHDSKNLEALRKRMWPLWGELEEHRSLEEAKRAKSTKAAKENKPPMDSADEEEPAPKAASKNKAMNRPFPCCIRQYGIKVGEADPAKADAGEGRRWDRVYSMFGTKISGV
ncbi:hypothetical protein G7046_g7869 [Stylonectria norvegica]|nr:hypothetical protein G7046_g7869 [Stylonectria norvegica]